MPGMDGFQLISRIWELSDAHLLVLTALEGEENLVMGLELVADEFLVKPISQRAFLARVRPLLRRAAPPEETVPGYRDAALTLDFVT